MKKILYASLAAVLFASCDLDINEDPNAPQNDLITEELIFPSISVSLASAVGGQIYNYAGFFAQYYEQQPTMQQYYKFCDYTMKEADTPMDAAYITLYARTLADAEQILKMSTNSANRFATTLLKAYSFMIMVDNTSDAPYTEALKGTEIPMPKWDDGETVYRGLLAEIDAAEAALDGTAMTVPDLVLDQDIAQWKGFANALRLRMYLRFIDANIDAAAFAEKTKALVQNNEFFSRDVKLDCFIDQTDKRNPWYTTNAVGLPGNHCAAYPLITYLNTTNDPRIAYGFNVAEETGTYVGQIPGGKAPIQSDLGASNYTGADVSGVNYDVGTTAPVYFFTQAELQFLIAEVYMRFFTDEAKAQTAYEAGVTADFAARNMAGEETAILEGAGSWATVTTSEEKLTLIYMQKWVALFYMNHMEAWSEIRRTDCPKLSTHTAEEIYEDATIYTPGELIVPWVNGLQIGGLMKRIPYPNEARKFNSNTPESPEGSVPVWWDIK